jgi:hypothetical protein
LSSGPRTRRITGTILAPRTGPPPAIDAVAVEEVGQPLLLAS